MIDKEFNTWLSRYATGCHAWKSTILNGKKCYIRPLGLVETSFDIDGIHYGGRADMHIHYTVELNHNLSNEDLRRRILLAWASLRLQHVLLMSKAYEEKGTGRHFLIPLFKDMDEVLQETVKNVVFVEDYYPSVDGHEFRRHAMNVARIIKAEECLSRLMVLPLVSLPNGNFYLRFSIVTGHQISDGLSAYNWYSHFLRILNSPVADIERDIEFFRSEENIAIRLPPSQEDLYPPIGGNRARQRWFWAIIRVLRYVQRTLPPTITNPLRREKRLTQVESFSPVFDKLFDYSLRNRPPLNAYSCFLWLSAAASQRMIQLCREAKVSIGAGCFALVGLAMMELDEARHPDVPLEARRPFAASFPLNPRPFFGITGLAESCMLSFADGIMMPFLSSELPVEGRFKLLAKQANRQLRRYQKRLKPTGANSSFDPHSPGRILANGYISQLERVEFKLPNRLKRGINPQGSLSARVSQFGATCGVSSVGSTAAFGFKEGQFDLNDVEKGTKDFVCDYRDLEMAVRARDNEFLVGSFTNSEGIVGFGVSFDGCAISEEAAAVWAEKMQSLLGKDEKARL